MTPFPVRERSFLKLKLLSTGAIVLLLALGFNALLISSSLEKLYVRSLVSSYREIGSEFRRKLQKGVRYGKRINKFVGMDQLMAPPLRHMLRQTKARASKNQKAIGNADIFIAVALPDGEIKYSTNKTLVGSGLPEDVKNASASLGVDSPSIDANSFIKNNRTYYVPLGIKGPKGSSVATVILAFHEKYVKRLVNAAWRYNVKVAIVSLICGSFLMSAMLYLLLPRERAKMKALFPWLFRGTARTTSAGIPKRAISSGLFLIIIACQIGFSAVSIREFNSFYLGITGDKTITLNTLMQENIEFLLKKQLPLNRLFRLETVMKEMLSHLSEIEDITLFNEAGKPLYHANQEAAYNLIKNPVKLDPDIVEIGSNSQNRYNYRMPVTKKGETVGIISSNISRRVVRQRLKALLLDAGTVLVISALFALELLLVIYLYLDRKTSDYTSSVRSNYGIIRPAAFLFLFGSYISISFVPLHMEKLFVPLFGLPKDLIMGLPISIEMFFAGVSILISGACIDKYGWYKPFVIGLFTTGIGLFDSWLAQSAVHFILARGIVGAGYGLVLMAAQGFVLANTDENTKARGIANLFAGVYAGSICGGAAGAMLADRVGYNPVFLVGAVIVFIAVPFSLFSMLGVIKKPAAVTDKPVSESVSPRLKMKQLVRFLLNRNVASLFLFIIIPASATLVGFLNYFSPIYLNRMGVSQSDIGRVIMIYGICLIFIGPFISKRIDRFENKKAFIVTGEIIGALGLLAFLFLDGIWATGLAILMLGISGSFISSRIAFILKLQVSRELGSGMSIGLLNSFYRLGQVFGPVLFSWILVATGVGKGISLLGIVYLIAVCLFLLLAQRQKNTAV